ncbi:MAG: hypothetical protein Q7S09_03295 [bacterium]|nr:hypothetical protein [bacterium]
MFFLQKPFYIARIFKTRDWARIMVFLAFCAVSFGVAAGAYLGFLRGFRFFTEDLYFGAALSAYALEATFFIILILVFASATVSGLWMLFGSAENQFLLSTPLSRYKIFFLKFLENLFASAWPILLIGIPAIAAFSRVYATSLLSALSFSLIFGVVFVGVVALAGIADFALIHFFRMVSGKRMSLLIGALFIGGAYVIGRVLLPIDLKALFSAERFDVLSAPVGLIFSHFENTPTHAAVAFLFKDSGAALGKKALAVVFETLLFLGGLFALVRWSYFKVLSRSFEGMFLARPEDSAYIRAGFKKFPLLCKGAIGALLEKDMLVFFRSPRETTRAFFLLFMLFLYLFLFWRLKARGIELTQEILSRVLLFNFAVIGYFITTLSLRFVFPLISLEGKSAWAVFASPLRRIGVFWEKLFFGLVPITLAIIFLALGSVRVLGLEGPELFVFLWIVFGMSTVLVTLSFVAGVLWPNFHDRDPDKLSTTMPGLFVTALSLGYVALAAFTGFRSIQAYFFQSEALLPVIIPLAALNLFTLIFLLWLGTHRIKTLDVSA